MTCLRFFLPAVFVLSAFGQSPQNAVDPTRLTNKVVKTILDVSLGQGTLPVTYLERATGRVKETACSVPLIEMKVPKDVNFTMAHVPPPQGFNDNMPVAQGLPACSAGPGH
jgi:hypothetical protein